MNIRSLFKINKFIPSLVLLVLAVTVNAQESQTLSQNAINTDGKSYDITSAMLLEVYDDNLSSVNHGAASINDYLNLFFTFDTDPSQDGQLADFFVVIKINKNFYMLNSSGNGLSWNGSLKSLVPYVSDVVLNDYTSLSVNFNKFTTTGNYRFFTGYKLQNNAVFHVTQQPASITLTEPTNVDPDSEGEEAFPEPPDNSAPEVNPFYLDHLKTFSILEEGEKYDQDFYMWENTAYSLVRTGTLFDSKAAYIDIYDLSDPTNLLESRDTGRCSPYSVVPPSMEGRDIIHSFRGIKSGVFENKLGIELTLDQSFDSILNDPDRLSTGKAFVTLNGVDCDDYADKYVDGTQLSKGDIYGGDIVASRFGISENFLGDFYSDGGVTCSNCVKYLYQEGTGGDQGISVDQGEGYFIVGDVYQLSNGALQIPIYEYVDDFLGGSYLLGFIDTKDEDGKEYTEYPLVTTDYFNEGDSYLGTGTFIEKWYWLGNNSAAVITDNLVNFVRFQDISDPLIYSQVLLSESQSESIVNSLNLDGRLVIGTTNATYIVDAPSSSPTSFYEEGQYFQKIDQPGYNLSYATHAELGIPVGPGVIINPDKGYLLIGDYDNITIYSPATSSEVNIPGYYIPRYEVDIADRIEGRWRFNQGMVYDQTRDGFAVYELNFE